jgi:anti-sigma factor RsiW
LSCPDLLVLSQLADGELPPADAAPVESHVAGCEHCSGWLARVRLVLAALADAGAQGRLAHAPQRRDDCPSASTLAGWSDAAAPEDDREKVRRHLDSCDACLADALAASRLIGRLDATPATPVPAKLRSLVAASWSKPQPASESLSAIVVRVTRAGAQLIESRLLAPLRDLVELPMPLPAMRSAGVPAEALYFCLHASAATVTATVVPVGDAVGLTLVIEDSSGTVLAGQRVFVRRHGRSIFSARTDATGALRMPSLERGVHEVNCPGIGTSFRLDLRS